MNQQRGCRGGRRLQQLRGLIVIVLLALPAACDRAETSTGSASSINVPSPASIYFTSDATGWPLRKAHNPAADDPISSRAEPTLDWFAEYERYPDPSRSQSVRLSGHNVSVARLEETLVGFELGARTVMTKAGRAGSGPDGPRVVLVPVTAHYTVMTLSYELSLDELVGWSNSLRPVDEGGWVARGGVIAS